MNHYIDVQGLHISYDGVEQAVLDVSFHIDKGESVGFMGESGSGKSSLVLMLMGLLPEDAHVSGVAVIDNIVLEHGHEAIWEPLRWKKVALVFQNSANVLNPLLKVRDQLIETMKRHSLYQDKEQVSHYLNLVSFDLRFIDSYPHELSGGMRQKVLIAMALSCEPECLLVDEPTMALDATSKYEIVQLLKRLQREKGLTMLVISHELHILAELVTRLYVMYAGQLVETGETDILVHEPKHPYTYGLVHASPSIHPFRDLWGIAGEMQRNSHMQCVFYERCFQRTDTCLQSRPVLKPYEKQFVACTHGGIRPILNAYHIQKSYFQNGLEIIACADNSITVYTGEIVALIGQSGSGKSTFAEIISGLLIPDTGHIVFDGELLKPFEQTAKKHGIQHIFQDPFTAINEQLSVVQIVGETIELNERLKQDSLRQRVKTVLRQVGLPNDDAFLNRKGFSLSGGMRQRLAIARSLIMYPKLIVADEMTAMLDPSNAANILRLLKGLQMEHGFSMLFITHDLALAQKIADRVIVMKDGRIIEEGPTTKVLSMPQENYTKMLVKPSLMIKKKLSSE